MTPLRSLSHRATRGHGTSGAAVAAAVLAMFFATDLLAQAPAAAPATASAGVPAEQLEKLVAPIALYPDDLVGIILPAATNPLQLVQADRYLDKRKQDPKLAVDERWDDAVKSLLNYPEVVKTMSTDLDWTTALGEAVVTDQGEVLQAIQAFRRKTHAVGNLKTDAKQVIVVEKEVIKIVPADPQVIYVPQYNPATVVVYGGYSSWAYYPTPYPVYYYPYPPGAAFATGLIWGAAISSAWHGHHYVAHYGSNANININRNVNINTGNINTGNINTGNVNRGGATTSQWSSGKQPGQVSGSVGASATNRVGYSSTKAAAPTAAPRASTQPAAAARSQPSGTTASASAFDGYGSGRQTQMDSTRGASSRSSMAAPAAQSRPSAGARAGGGRR